MEDLNQVAEKNPLLHHDWRVWAEINYLDSATEYREYVPTAPIQNPLTREAFGTLYIQALVETAKVGLASDHIPRRCADRGVLPVPFHGSP